MTITTEKKTKRVLSYSLNVDEQHARLATMCAAKRGFRRKHDYIQKLIAADARRLKISV
jgi:hypothetical protein